MNAPSNSSEKDSRHAASAALENPIPYLGDHGLWAWGVDLSTTQLDIGVVNGTGTRIGHRSIPLPDNNWDIASRCHGTFAATVKLAHELCHDRLPGLICVEQPSGRFVHPSTRYAYANILSGLLETCGLDTMVVTVPPSRWKQTVLGTGAASKADGAAFIRKNYNHVVASHDESDALCIAIHARWLAGAVR